MCRCAGGIGGCVATFSDCMDMILKVGLAEPVHGDGY